MNKKEYMSEKNTKRSKPSSLIWTFNEFYHTLPFIETLNFATREGLRVILS